MPGESAVGELEFRILGPLEALHRGEPLPLGAVRQRAVLALLLTRANEIVSRDRLIEELWGRRPARARPSTSCRRYVSHLRKALPEGVLETRPPGYLVGWRPVRSTCTASSGSRTTAAQALAGGRAADAASALREALALWRGAPLADFAYEPFAQAEIARLEELRLAALERRVEADLALGRHAELVAELEALVAQHPLRERLRAHLMLALYRAGRQADALAAYQAARRALVDELGIDPGPALQELERAILRHDAALDPPPSAPPDSPRPAAGVAPSRRCLLVLPQSGEHLDALIALAEPLARRPPRDLILAWLVADAAELGHANAALHAHRDRLSGQGVATRAVAFTSDDPGEDAVRLAHQQDVDLVLVDVEPDELERRLASGALADVLAGSPCDVGVLVGARGRPGGRRRRARSLRRRRARVGGREVGAWVASAHGSSLRCWGRTATGGRASATRAGCSRPSR